MRWINSSSSQGHNCPVLSNSRDRSIYRPTVLSCLLGLVILHLLYVTIVCSLIRVWLRRLSSWVFFREGVKIKDQQKIKKWCNRMTHEDANRAPMIKSIIYLFHNRPHHRFQKNDINNGEYFDNCCILCTFQKKKFSRNLVKTNGYL